MTIQTWDPNRVGGGTIELIQDPTTGVFTTNEVGFVKLPDLSLPEITQADYTTTPDPDTDTDPDSDPCPDGYSLVDGTCQPTGTPSSGGGGGGYGQDYTGETAHDETLGKQQYWSRGDWGPKGKSPYQHPLPPKSGVDVHDMDAYANRRVDVHDFEGVDFNKQQLASSDRGPLDDPDRFGSPVQKKEILWVDSTGQKYYKAPERFQPEVIKTDSVTKGGLSKRFDTDRRPVEYSTIRPHGIDARPVSTYNERWDTGLDDPISQGIAPQFGGTILEDEFPSTPRPVPFGTPTDRKQGFMKDKIIKPDLKGVKEVGKDLVAKKFTNTLKINAKELVEKGKKSLKIVPLTVRLMSGALDAVFGVTDADRMRQTTNKNALTSLGYKTRGGNVDAGRVAGNPATSVFAGMNMVSAKGDIMSGARNRVSNLGKTIANLDKNWSKLKRTDPAAFNAKKARLEKKQNDFKKELNKAQARKNQQTMNQGRPGRDDGSGAPGCFIKGTLVTMLNGSKKPIEQVDLGDNVAKGGKVFAVGRFLINNLYDYKGIKVSGSHMVNEDDKWIRIEDSKHGKALGNDEHTVYVFGSENRRILINDILFTDYFEVTDQEKLLKYEDKFFDNWGIYSKNENTNNVNILNAS